ncbi:HEAT repeat domain-containing protein [Peribacillus deserti]|uniref:HEAT repeat domain-containing protein n=1 Tax=Peribacillus deserti TaxID=673318 RepID=A0A2N5LZX0_9BACI|nr:HEAT repeat domain-containing protein [Peribacillus deserti]PLT27666.1 hypothetical protein CUU66_22700 [Peribacillus deserti]
MFKNEIYLLAAATALIVIILSLMLIYLVYRKTFEIKTRAQIEQMKKELEPKLLTYVMEQKWASALRVDSKVKKRALEELLSSLASVLQGEELTRNVARIADHQLSGYYKTELKSRLWSTRMNALFHIDIFSISSLEKDILVLLHSRRPSAEERHHCYRILASFNYHGLIELISNDPDGVSEFEYRHILYRINRNQYDQMVLSFYKFNDALKYAILDCIGMQKRLEYTPFLESVAEHTSGECKIRALKALISVGHVKDVNKYLILSKSREWQERMLAAKMFGVVRDKSLIQTLVELMHDQSWWVRFQAGSSIRKYPDGEKTLLSIYQNDSDPYARDMAWEWVNEGDGYTFDNNGLV